MRTHIILPDILLWPFLHLVLVDLDLDLLAGSVLSWAIEKLLGVLVLLLVRGVAIHTRN